LTIHSFNVPHNSENRCKFYIGQGLREDLAKVFSERLLDKTAQVLARHLESAEEISTLLREIQAETAR
jgi:hypothetical protein